MESWSQMSVATVESVLLYGAETWTLTANLERALDGVYTRMLRMALDVHWDGKTIMPNSQLYAARPTKRLAGHCVRHPELAVSPPIVLWEPIDGNRSKGRRRITFVDLS